MQEKRDEIRQKLWRSLELAVLRRDGLIFFLVDLGFCLIIGIQLEGEQILPVMLLSQICFLPWIGYYLIRVLKIFRKTEGYTFHRCKLFQPRVRPFLKMMYFSILLDDEDGGKFLAETSPIFAPYGILDPLMQDYIDQTVTIAYHPETEQVVVIG